MNQRERTLAVAVVTIGALYGGYQMYGKYTKALHSRQIELEAAQKKFDEANRKLTEGRRAVKQLQAAQARALPANFDKALSLYKAWLLAKAKDSGLTVSDITQLPVSSTNAAYQAVSYQVVASGSLSSVVSMLYEFYRSPQLHQVTRLQLTRPAGATNLTVSLDVEALRMKGAVATDKLPEGELKRLKLASADEYKKSLAERDIVTAYTPPRPPAPPRERREAPPAPPKFDDSELAFFTGAIGSGVGSEVWINVRPTGETLHLTMGDEVKIGALEGKIEAVEERAIVLKIGDKSFRVRLGESLRKGKEIGGKGDGSPKQEAAEAAPKS